MLLSLLWLACAPEPGPSASVSLTPVDEAEVAEALSRVQPESALRLLDGLMGELASPECEVLEFDDGPEGTRQLWTECPDAAGTVERYEDGELAWMEVSGLVAEDLRMDGAIELVVLDELGSLQWAATFCEGACDDAVQVDLSWTLVPDDHGTDVLVTGTLATGELGPMGVEGTMRLDPEACGTQPVDGLLLIEGERTHTLRFDDTCDGCAVWSVDGVEVGAYCE